MMNVAQTLVAGVVTIGIITALFMNGRSTATTATAVFNGSSKLLGTAIKG